MSEKLNTLRFAAMAVAVIIAAQGLSRAQGLLPYNPEDSPTWISTEYFGPNAFPVPDMVKSTTGRLEVEFNGTSGFGYISSASTDRTQSVDFRARIPLWTDRVNFCIWGQIYEWYQDTPEVRAIRRVSPDEPLNGGQAGDLYFSIDVRVLNEKAAAPCLTLRAACKSASGGQYTRARYYDCPGYFFDVCASKGWAVGENSAIRIAATTGFLCWQVDNGRQNDAVMYGASAAIHTVPVNVSADFGGYAGWKNEGDRPMTLKLRADILPEKAVSPFVQYQHGFGDWPFDQMKAGVRIGIAGVCD